jgi:hypothetical protein
VCSHEDMCDSLVLIWLISIMSRLTDPYIVSLSMVFSLQILLASLNKTRPHSPKKFKQGNTCPLTTKQINRYTHPLNLLLKLVQKDSPTKPAVEEDRRAAVLSFSYLSRVCASLTLKSIHLSCVASLN